MISFCVVLRPEEARLGLLGRFLDGERGSGPRESEVDLEYPEPRPKSAVSSLELLPSRASLAPRVARLLPGLRAEVRGSVSEREE